jgi:beta-fructofuranosidase
MSHRTGLRQSNAHAIRKTMKRESLRYAAWIAAALVSSAVAGTARTLVSWVSLAGTDQRGGSALTIQRGEEFDAIVFGERAPGRWMAGSHLFARTQPEQDSNAVETSTNGALVQMAIQYQGNRISIFRHGELYASYDARNINLLDASDCVAVFGVRHRGAQSGAALQGSIEDARIYDRALTTAELKSLQPNRESIIKPWAWWTFEKGEETDRMKRFPVNRLSGGARIENGRLQLKGPTAMLTAPSPAAASELAAEATPAEVEVYRTFRKKLLADRSRPLYHLVNPEGSAVPADPNGAIYWKGRYHLHYIVNDGGFSYAHVSSTDMVHWRWHALTLTPAMTGHGMFSGTCFLNKDGVPTLIYHGQGSGRNQLAMAADDNLEKWDPIWPIEPKVRPDQDGSKISHWDPDGWVDANASYALFGGHPGSGKPPTLMRSADLRSWEYVGLFMSRDMPDVGKDEDVSCPNFFKIGSQHMLLCISHNRGCRYYLGDWRNEQFTPVVHQRMNWSGLDFFAPESLLTPDGRRVMWAWCTGGGNSLWNGIQSLPRELSLPEDGILRIKPLRELEQLRYASTDLSNIIVQNDQPYGLSQMGGDSVELEATFKSGSAKRFGLRVHANADSGGGIEVAVVPAKAVVTLGETAAPFALKAGEDAHLRVFVDRRIVEVFINDRQALFKQHAYAPDDTGLCLFSEGAPTEVPEVKAWKMAPSNPW